MSGYKGKIDITKAISYAKQVYQPLAEFGNPPPLPPSAFLLLEDGAYILLEDGGRIKLDD